MKPTTNPETTEVRPIAGDLRHLLATLARLKPAALRRALDDMQPGYPTGGDETPVARSDVSDPTGEAATNRNRPGDAWHRYARALHRAADAVDEMWRIERFWLDDANHRQAGSYGVASCANVHCREPVPLTAQQVTDPEPARCPACHGYYMRHSRDMTAEGVRSRRRRSEPAAT